MEYRQLNPSDTALFSEGLDLLNRTQGRDLFASDYLTMRTSDPKSYVIAALENGKIIGLGVAQIIDSFDFYLPFDSNISNELQHKKVGSFSTLCITESLQGKGIGKILSQFRLDWLKEQKCEVIVGVSWVSGLAHTSNRVFHKMGFRPVKEVDQFFYQSSIEKPFVCPGCGEPPCTCNAIMYRLDL